MVVFRGNDFKPSDLELKSYGRHEWFYRNGKLHRRVNFKDGKEDGLWEFYGEGGNLTKTEEWEDGKLIPFKKT